jgi:hypothetical protein
MAQLAGDVEGLAMTVARNVLVGWAIISIPATFLLLCALKVGGSSSAAGIGPQRCRSTGRSAGPQGALTRRAAGPLPFSGAGRPPTSNPARFQLVDCPTDGRSCVLQADLTADHGECLTHGTVIRQRR